MNWYTALINYLISFFSTSQNETVKKIQALTIQFCRFEPEAESVALMLTASNPTAVGVVAIARAICAAVGPLPVMGLANLNEEDKPTVNGVLVKGRFV